MNVAKNMEFVFVAALAIALSLSNTIAAPAAPVQVTAAKPAIWEAPAITVVVVGKRLTDGTKAKRTI